MSRDKKKISLNADSSQLGQGLFGGIDTIAASSSENISFAKKKSANTVNPNKAKRITLRREKSGRGGKVVTLVCDFPPTCNAPWREAFLKRAKQQLGCGGKLQADAIELQGDCREKLLQLLQDQGFKPVIAGG